MIMSLFQKFKKGDGVDARDIANDKLKNSVQELKEVRQKLNGKTKDDPVEVKQVVEKY